MKNTHSLQSLFNDRIFRVPKYQRGYAWEKQHVGEFLDDLSLLSLNRRHYTGTVVLFQSIDAIERVDNEGNSHIETEVVDGQQRLTTIVMLLNELSSALGTYASSISLSNGIKKKYVEAVDMDGQSVHKLSLNEDIDHYFKASVLAQSTSLAAAPVKSAQRLMDAKQQIVKFLADPRGDNLKRESWLRDMYKRVLQLHFTLYELEQDAEVGVIFEVMNDRGKPLTDLEKVKNFLLYAASVLNVEEANRDNFVKSVQSAWADILRQLMAADLGNPSYENQLLRTHWIMKYDPQSKNWRGSKSVRRKFDLRKCSHARLLGELHAYVEGLRNSCAAFCDALNPERDQAFGSFSADSNAREDVICWNVKFVRLGSMATFLPLLMAVRMRWSTDPGKYLDILKLCEALTFQVYRISGYRSNYRQPAIFRLAHRVAQEMGYDDSVLELKNEFGDVYIRQEFIKFTDASVPNALYGWPSLKYFLYEYEWNLAQAQGALPRVHWNELSRNDSIEHILPQSIEGILYWQDRYDNSTHDEVLHDIGNLVLTKDNSQLQNKSFPEKKGAMDSEARCYARSVIIQEREIAARWDDWTVDSIAERRSKLLRWAKKRWYVETGDV